MGALYPTGNIGGGRGGWAGAPAADDEASLGVDVGEGLLVDFEEFPAFPDFTTLRGPLRGGILPLSSYLICYPVTSIPVSRNPGTWAETVPPREPKHRPTVSLIFLKHVHAIGRMQRGVAESNTPRSSSFLAFALQPTTTQSPKDVLKDHESHDAKESSHRRLRSWRCCYCCKTRLCGV
jgi:hypothetical protein